MKLLYLKNIGLTQRIWFNTKSHMQIKSSIKENWEDTAYIDLKITTTYVFEGLYENFQMMQQLSLLLQLKYDHHVICVLLSMSSTFVYLMSVG